ncbi:MAG: hypothetical protein F6K54_03110 [Okeania sp. SIO3B5]|uniref:hypothetical protein n=1 Tax=Okeania sp. SIO3B5 TaxID=2607811 RepID=UPI0013FE8DB7|nr:hypothetical protein [Okeania sp. SIO3B5]NEO52160.1 hypothetical protein [Okeania sp. SIO3B5]
MKRRYMEIGENYHLFFSTQLSIILDIPIDVISVISYQLSVISYQLSVISSSGCLRSIP